MSITNREGEAVDVSLHGEESQIRKRESARIRKREIEDAYQEMREDVKSYMARIEKTSDIDEATDAFILATQAVCRHYEKSPRVPASDAR